MTVYFIRRNNDLQGLVKIGFTNNLDERLNAFKAQYPEGIECLVAVPGGRETETILHALFASSHHVGEWFNLTAEISSAIKALAALPTKPTEPSPVTISSPIIDVDVASLTSAVWDAAPHLDTLSDEDGQSLRQLRWDERLRLSAAYRDRGATAAEWLMPELFKPGQPA